MFIVEISFLVVTSPPPVDNQTVPSSRFTRPPADVVSPPSTPAPHQQKQPQTPQTPETKGTSRPPLVHQRSSASGSAIEAITRQMSLSSMSGNDASTNGQPTIQVKDAKVTPSSDFVGAVTRAKEGELICFSELTNINRMYN